MRRKGQIDHILRLIICDDDDDKKNYKKKNKKKSKKYPPKCGKYTDIVTSCLRIGVTQILFMDVTNFAAVKETVSVLKFKQYQTP